MDKRMDKAGAIGSAPNFASTNVSFAFQSGASQDRARIADESLANVEPDLIDDFYTR